MIPSQNPNSNTQTPAPGRAPACSDALTRAWLHLSLQTGIGPVRTLALLRRFRNPLGIFDADPAALAAILGNRLASQLLSTTGQLDQQVDQALRWLDQPGHHLLTLDDPRYPGALLHTADPPPVLYVRGDPAVLNRPGLAIVGSRHATQAGLDNALAFAAHLGQVGLTVVSGLARGIDAAAHLGAIQNNALTVAVMGTGSDRVYPAAHRHLADQVADNGAVITEMPLGTTPKRGHFPRRNRLIAGLSIGVLVIEAARHSGSLSTARHALDNNREVFAIPGSIHSPVARGCHYLIRQGAKLVECAQDIIDELPPDLAATLQMPRAGMATTPSGQEAAAGLPNEMQAVLEALDWDGQTEEQLLGTVPTGAIKDRLHPARLAELLLELELAGLLERLPNGRIRRRATRV